MFSVCAAMRWNSNLLLIDHSVSLFCFGPSPPVLPAGNTFVHWLKGREGGEAGAWCALELGLTGFLFDLTQDTEEGGLHPVTV